MIQHGAGGTAMRVWFDPSTAEFQPVGEHARGYGALFDDFDHQPLEHGQQDGMGFVVPVIARFKHGTEDVARD
jgi:hypothetical protein